ncbi:MAG: hypothetical protein M1470_14950 [Bacteroidetes bacterium]|nr:hypothetical protein [Bacteroidota bacterium]MCL5737503.1 hypothetical protein [Bacteroidota bacterium]
MAYNEAKAVVATAHLCHDLKVVATEIIHLSSATGYMTQRHHFARFAWNISVNLTQSRVVFKTLVRDKQ